MNFKKDYTYHVYNRSNEKIFYNRANYLYFLNKIKINIIPFADIVAWCLMPNHFHILLVANKEGCDLVNEPHRLTTQNLSKNIGSLLSAYTRAINKEFKRKGSLFAHQTKAKCLNDFPNNDNFLINCFHYIHQNPVRSNLCNNLKDWEFSSFLDYCNLRNGQLINKELGREMINYDPNNFELQANTLINRSKISSLFE